MRIDPDVLKQVTGAFLDAERPIVTWNEIHAAVPDQSDENLAWYLDLLHDDGHVVRNDGEYGIGVKRDTLDNVYPSAIPLRLTSRGMNFASNLHRPDAMRLLDKALRGVKYVSLQLLSGALDQWADTGFKLPE